MTAYVCGGKETVGTLTTWFLGQRAGTAFDVPTGSKGQERLRGEVHGEEAAGTLIGDRSRRHSWTAHAVAQGSDAGLYMATGQHEVCAVIVLEDRHAQGATYDRRSHALRPVGEMKLVKSAAGSEVLLGDEDGALRLVHLHLPLVLTDGAAEILRSVADAGRGEQEDRRADVSVAPAVEKQGSTEQSPATIEESPELGALEGDAEREIAGSRAALPSPRIEPTDDAVFDGPIQVTLSVAAPNVPGGAVIRYTIDGSDPSETSARFDARSGGSFSLDHAAMVKARLVPVGGDWHASDLAIARYQFVHAALPRPAFDPSNGAHDGELEVKLIPPELDAKRWDQVRIWYCMDSSQDAVPCCEEAMLYRGEPITIAAESVSRTVTLKARLQARSRETGEDCVGPPASARFEIRPKR
ncbi:MAG: chitobiase/beta-hexosaminidase C-terminal domain-containing protein [Planctomycetota bacterium]